MSSGGRRSTPPPVPDPAPMPVASDAKIRDSVMRSRRKSMLDRVRGRAGTIRTGYQPVGIPTDQAVTKKTVLG